MTEPLHMTNANAPETPEGFLGPARVVAVAAGRIEAQLGESGPTREVRLGMSFPYTPAPGDELLVIEGRDACYAVGVLSATRPQALSFQGDVDVHAVGGTLTLSGEEGVDLEAPRLTLRGETLRTFAGSVSEKADEAYRWVKGLLTVRAGQAQRVVDGEDHSRSERTVILAKGTVKIDGSYLNLGS